MALVVAVVTCYAPTAAAQLELYRAIFTPDGAGLIVPTKLGENCFLYRADIATGVTHRVTSAASGCESEPSFSPDGRKLVFLRIAHIGESASIVTANADGTDERILVSNQSANLNPYFVPHRNEVVYLRTAQPHQHKFDVYTVDLTTRASTRLTHQEYFDISDLSVSPDGRQLLLSMLTDTTGVHFVVSSIDSAERPIMRLRPQPFAFVASAMWLPDGRGLLFAGATKAPSDSSLDYNVYRLTLGNGEIAPLTRFTGAFSGFSVSADGTKMVVLSHNAYSVIDIMTRHVSQVPLELQR